MQSQRKPASRCLFSLSKRCSQWCEYCILVSEWNFTLVLMQTKGEQFLHALSAILEGRHRAPLRFFLFSLRRHHIRPGHSTETQEALGLWRSEPGEDRPVWSGNSTPQHTRAPGETANVMNTGLKAFSQRRACLPHSEHCGRPSASLRRPAVGLHLSEALFPGARVCTACWGL